MRKDLLLPLARRDLKTLQLLQNLDCACLPMKLLSGRNVLPATQPAHELGGSDRINLLAKRADREPLNPRQQPPVAPLQFCNAQKFSAKNSSRSFQPQ